MIRVEGGGRRVADVAGLATWSPVVFALCTFRPRANFLGALVAGSPSRVLGLLQKNRRQVSWCPQPLRSRASRTRCFFARAATEMRWRLRSGWSLGVLLIVIVAFIWNAASVLVQYIFADYTFFRPFFLTYLANSLFVVTLPLRSLSQLVRRRSSSPTEAHGSADSLRVTARAALVVCPLWFLANFRRAAPPLRRRCTAAHTPLHRHTDTARHNVRCRMAVTTGAWA